MPQRNLSSGQFQFPDECLTLILNDYILLLDAEAHHLLQSFIVELKQHRGIAMTKE